MAAIPESAAVFMSGLIERARRLPKTIVFPEGGDPRVLEAAARLARDGVVKPLLVGPSRRALPRGWPSPIRRAGHRRKKYAVLYHERRRAKGITQNGSG